MSDGAAGASPQATNAGWFNSIFEMNRMRK